MQSKKQRILDLLETTDLTNRQIASLVGCGPEYVRTVQQRLIQGGRTKSELRWLAANKDWDRQYRARKKLARALETA